MVAITGISSITATGASVALGSFGADGTVEFQISTQPTFEHCVCPVIPGIARSSPQTLSGLNQATTYYIRARDKSAAGVFGAWTAAVPFRTPLSSAPSTSPDEIMIEPVLVVVPVPVITWGADNALTAHPVLNLGYDAPVAWRSQPAGNDHAFTAYMAPDDVDTIAILMTNLPEAATVVIKAGTTNGVSDYRYPSSGSTAFRASANLPGRPGYHGIIRLPSVQNYAYWRVEITAALTGKLLHVEHAVFGKALQTKNYSQGKSEDLIDMGSLSRNRSGVPIRTLGARLRRVNFDISMLSEEQFELNYGQLSKAVGSTQPVLVVPNSKANAFFHDRILYGAIVDSREINPASPRFTKSFVVESLL